MDSKLRFGSIPRALAIERQRGQQISPSPPAMAGQVSQDVSQTGSLPREEQEDMETSPKKKFKSSADEIPSPFKENHFGTDYLVGSLSGGENSQETTDSVVGTEASSDVIAEFVEGHAGDSIDEAQESRNFSEKGNLVRVQQGVSGIKQSDVVAGTVSELGDGSKEVKCLSGNRKDSEGVQLDKEEDRESLLEAEKKRLLAELECGLLRDLPHSEKITGFSDFFTIGEKGNVDQESQKGATASNACVGGPLKIEVIDDTALVDIVPLSNGGNGIARERETLRSGKSLEKNHKNHCEKPADAQQMRRSRRNKKGKAARTIGQNENSSSVFLLPKDFRKDENQPKFVYSRQELEALRFAMISEQKKLWKDIYAGLAPHVISEYNDLAASSRQRKTVPLNIENAPPILRKEDGYGILGEDISTNMEKEMESLNVQEHASYENLTGGFDASLVEQEYHGDDDSDDDYDSILKPAFAVEGEPDFDSGPPEDGFEYLRRVRWEAAQIPNVKVVKIDGSKHRQERSVYMPQIPEIPKCPEHLLPLKEWEDEFLSDFSKLRMALSRLLEDGNWEVPSSLVVKHGDSCQLQENYDTEVSCPDEEESSWNIPKPKQNPNGKASGGDTRSDHPTLSAIYKMDPVARVTMLRKRISSFEAKNDLSRSDGLWLFALCASVDTPLDADTSASLRSLLRKCATLRAEKSEVDDEVVMADILATISGRYFGQLES